MADDGSDMRQLTQAYADGESHAGPIWHGDTSGSVSPSGRYLATSRTHARQGTRIWLRDLVTGQVRRLSPPFPSGDEDNGNTLYDRGTSWSPDGRHLVFVSNRERGVMGHEDVYRIEVATGELVQLTHDGMWKRGAGYTPDGRRIVFGVDGFDWDPPGSSGTYSIDTDGGDRRRLSNSPLVRPTYSPDGERFAFTTIDGLFVVEGSEVRKVVSSRVVWRTPSVSLGWVVMGSVWADGGQSLVFGAIDSSLESPESSAAIFKIPVAGADEPTQITPYGSQDSPSQWFGRRPTEPAEGVEDDAPPAVELIDSVTGAMSVPPAGARTARRRVFTVGKERLDILGLDGTGLRRVDAAVAKETRGGRCRFLTRSGFGPARDCRRQRYFRVPNPDAWRARVERMPTGRRYAIWLRGRDILGHVTRRAQRLRVHLKR